MSIRWPGNPVMRADGIGSHIHKGTSQTVGYLARKYDHAVRRFHVLSTDNNDLTLGQAIQNISSWVAPTHPSITDLYAQKFRAIRLGPKKAIVDVVYFRDRWSLKTTVPGTISILRAGIESMTVYRSDIIGGDDAIDRDTLMPEGDIQVERVNDPDLRVWGRVYQLPVTKIFIPVTLYYSPLWEDAAGGGEMLKWAGMTNSDEVTFLGKTFNSNTIRFDSLEVTEEESRGGTRTYDVKYYFSIRGTGWYRQSPWKVVNEEGKFVKWEVSTIPYVQTPFFEQFPVNPYLP